MNIDAVLLIIAIVFFALAAYGLETARLVAGGLALVTLSMLI